MRRRTHKVGIDEFVDLLDPSLQAAAMGACVLAAVLNTVTSVLTETAAPQEGSAPDEKGAPLMARWVR